MKYSEEYKKTLKLAKALKQRDEILAIIKNLSINAENARKQSLKQKGTSEGLIAAGKRQRDLFYINAQKKNLKEVQKWIKDIQAELKAIK